MTHQARTAKQIGSIIRRTRRAQGLTQSQLGDQVGLRQATISTLEAGESGTRLSTLLDTMAALGLELVFRERGAKSFGERAADLEDLF